MVKSTSMWLFLFAFEIHTHYSFGIDSGTATSLKGTLSVASIAGIAVGIVAVISALLFALFILYRRRRPPNKHQDNTMPTDVVRAPMSTVVPFALQTSVAGHHRGGTGLYTPATESFTASSSSVNHDLL